MNIDIELPDYDGNALDIIWEKKSNYTIEILNEQIVIKANSNALISFAKQMLYMAYNDLITGSHIHYDNFFTKVNCDYELVIEKIGKSGNTGDGDK